MASRVCAPVGAVEHGLQVGLFVSAQIRLSSKRPLTVLVGTNVRLRGISGVSLLLALSDALRLL